MPAPETAGQSFVRPATKHGIAQLVKAYQQIVDVCSHQMAFSSSTVCAASTAALRVPPSAIFVALWFSAAA